MDDGWEEGGKGRECDVAGEEHEGGEIAFWVRQGMRDLAPIEFRFLFRGGEGVFFRRGLGG